MQQKMGTYMFLTSTFQGEIHWGNAPDPCFVVRVISPSFLRFQPQYNLPDKSKLHSSLSDNNNNSNINNLKKGGKFVFRLFEALFKYFDGMLHCKLADRIPTAFSQIVRQNARQDKTFRTLSSLHCSDNKKRP